MTVWFGGDYNPEQWPSEVWDEDVTLMRQAHVNLATVGVFSWARLEPREGEFDFAWLDDILDRLHAGGVRVDLATATASPPPWLAARYPETLPQTKDGVRLWPGSRQQYCPSSPVYRRLATTLVQKLVERYAQHPAVEMWHVNNEYGCHVSHCYCDVSAAAFRVWLEHKYTTIDALNAAWGTAFWSQHYSTFDEIEPPRSMPTFANPTQLIDFDRFSSDELLECYRAEVRVIRAAAGAPHPVTTNFMGFFKPVDYWTWADEVDIVADDSYPDPADPVAPIYAAMQRDLIRSLRHGQPWLLMEQAPGAVNWRTRNAPKAPGQMRAWSYQCLARGADGILFFQWRQSVQGSEKFHSGMLPHMGTDTRIWREIEALGRELDQHGDALTGRVDAKVAIVFDWDSWWAIEQDATPAQLSYVDTVFQWYRTLYELGVVVDFVRGTDGLADYAVVLAPVLHVTSQATIDNLGRFARQGGRLLVTYQSAILDENLRVVPGGYLGDLAAVLGIRVEEFAPPAGHGRLMDRAVPAATVAARGEELGEFSGSDWAEYVHATGADVHARFTDGVRDGWPAITANSIDLGVGWYAATLPDAGARSTLLRAILSDAGVAPALVHPIAGVEVVTRGELVFVINQSAEPVTVPIRGTNLLNDTTGDTIELEAFDVAVVRSGDAQ